MACVSALQHGNMVGGDETHMKIDVESGAELFLTTNRLKKVTYNASAAEIPAVLSNTFEVQPNGYCVYWPKPTNCCGDSVLSQRNTFSLNSGASLAFLDWIALAPDNTESFESKAAVHVRRPRKLECVNEIRIEGDLVFSSEMMLEDPLDQTRKDSGITGDVEEEGRQKPSTGTLESGFEGMFGYCTLDGSKTVESFDMSNYNAMACAVLVGPKVDNVLKDITSSQLALNGNECLLTQKALFRCGVEIGSMFKVAGRSIGDVQSLLKKSLRTLDENLNQSLWT